MLHALLNTLQAKLAVLRNEESGQDLAEYALLIALIALVVILAVTALGTQITGVFNAITAKLVF